LSLKWVAPEKRAKGSGKHTLSASKKEEGGDSTKRKNSGSDDRPKGVQGVMESEKHAFERESENPRRKKEVKCVKKASKWGWDQTAKTVEKTASSQGERKLR